MLNYILNTYLGNQVFSGGLQKIENDGHLGEDFEKEFNVTPSQMKIAGYFEAVGALLLFISIISKSLGRIGALMVGAVTSVAAVKHLKAGHGFEGSKAALKVTGLSALSVVLSFFKKL